MSWTSRVCRRNRRHLAASGAAEKKCSALSFAKYLLSFVIQHVRTSTLAPGHTFAVLLQSPNDDPALGVSIINQGFDGDAGLSAGCRHGIFGSTLLAVAAAAVAVASAV